MKTEIFIDCCQRLQGFAGLRTAEGVKVRTYGNGLFNAEKLWGS
ncbi:MAG: hypothetical protein ACYCT7_10475 [bacterium]